MTLSSKTRKRQSEFKNLVPKGVLNVNFNALYPLVGKNTANIEKYNCLWEI
jgi:hypothetical protein